MTLLLHEASIEELIAEIERRCSCMAVIYSRKDEKRSEVNEQSYSFGGGVHAAYGLATELKHRIREVLLSEPPDEQ